jgi:hypothetical protein
MKPPALLSLMAASLLAPAAARSDEPNQWAFDLSLYGLAAGMSGDVGIGTANANLDFGFDKVLDNLEFAMMGKLRLAYDRWALSTDVIYMGLQSTQNDVTLELDQWMVEPTLSYRVSKYFEPLAGVRYNNLNGEIRGPNLQLPGPGGLLDGPGIRSGTQDWWDPIVGANLSLPLGKVFSFNVRGDVGGFGVGSDFTWQAFPYLSWQFARWGSLQAGYRWLNVDYETGSGTSRFKYNMLIQGPQLGLTFHF